MEIDKIRNLGQEELLAQQRGREAILQRLKAHLALWDLSSQGAVEAQRESSEAKPTSESGHVLRPFEWKPRAR